MKETGATKQTGSLPEPVIQSDTATRAETVLVGTRIGRFRWSICALLFFATTINYIDRQVVGILAKDLQTLLGWHELDYGNIVAAFNGAYALGLLFAGRLMDLFGTRVGYTVALTLWSFAAMGHALARSAFGFGVARAFLGLGIRLIRQVQKLPGCV